MLLIERFWGELLKIGPSHLQNIGKAYNIEILVMMRPLDDRRKV